MSIAVYLYCVFGKSEAFGSDRPRLHEVFPNLFPRREDKKPGEEHAGEADAEAEDEDENHEEPAIYEEEKSFFKISVFGIPNWREPEWSYMTIGMNILLALFALDLVFRGPLLHPARDLSFTRVGFVDSTTAKVLVREPDPAQLPLYVYLSPADKTIWTTTETIYYLGADTDYTYPVTFGGLQPSKRYIYSLSNDKSGTFTTAHSPYSEAANKLNFLTSSCLKANFPYRPSAPALAIHGFEHLSKVLRGLPNPASFMLFLGDFIYVDVPFRLSSSLAHYRSEYRRVYSSPSWSLPGLDTLPWIHTLDDHEIANDWSGGNDTEPFPAASDPFIHYHVSVNPPTPPGAPPGAETNTTYFQFSNGPASFFMLDTRRYRTDPEPASSSSSSSNLPDTSTNHTMLGSVQLASLLKYLATPEPSHIHWKIIASSVPFTKNWRFGTSDTWGGFLQERSVILEAMHKAEKELGVRVIILSGDRHEFAAIRYPRFLATASYSDSKNQTKDMNVYETGPQAGPHEFSVGPLSMFYLPFRTFKQVDEDDVAIKYLPDGNSKVGVVEISNLGGNNELQRSLLRYKLYIDGELAWEYALTSPAEGSCRPKERGWLWM